MSSIDSKIVSFIKKHHVLTLATVSNGQPWCCNCFYAFHEDDQSLVFTSDDSTRHISEIFANPHVAGSIVLETKLIGKIQGVQFEAVIQQASAEHSVHRSTYLKRFPFAALATTHIWYAELQYIKFTDNTLGFGKKLIWKKGTC